MYKKPTRSQQVRKLALTYALMTFAVAAVVALLVFIMLGYRFNQESREIIQTGLVQFNSTPGDAVVEIDKRRLSGKTPTKSVVMPAQHEFAIWKEGYETWWKQLSISGGTVTWLDYARLVPKEKVVDTVFEYDALDQLVFSPGGRFAWALTDDTKPQLQLIDLRDNENVTQTPFTIPTESLLGYGEDDKKRHTFAVQEWDQDGRYALVSHTYDKIKEWILIDREDATKTQNISTVVNLPIQSAQLSGTNGDEVYILTSGSVRIVNVASGELSRPLASEVQSFTLYGTDIVTYVGNRGVGSTAERVIGVVKRGDTSPTVLKSVATSTDTPIAIKTARYYRQNYIAFSIGTSVEVYAGNYPTAAVTSSAESSDPLASMKLVTRFDMDNPVRWLQMSGNGRFIVAQDDDGYRSYDLERKELSRHVTVSGAASRPLPWLDSYTVWNVENDSMIMREFDGANEHALLGAQYRYGASLDARSEYLYAANQTSGGAVLQRLQMIVE